MSAHRQDAAPVPEPGDDGYTHYVDGNGDARPLVPGTVHAADRVLGRGFCVARTPDGGTVAVRKDKLRRGGAS